MAVVVRLIAAFALIVQLTAIGAMVVAIQALFPTGGRGRVADVVQAPSWLVAFAIVVGIAGLATIWSRTAGVVSALLAAVVSFVGLSFAAQRGGGSGSFLVIAATVSISAWVLQELAVARGGDLGHHSRALIGALALGSLGFAFVSVALLVQSVSEPA